MLILQTERDALLKPLQTATGIVERKHTLPILANVLLESKGGKVHILATDLEIQIHTQGADSEQGDFQLTTNAKKTARHPARAARKRHRAAGFGRTQAHAQSRQIALQPANPAARRFPHHEHQRNHPHPIFPAARNAETHD